MRLSVNFFLEKNRVKKSGKYALKIRIYFQRRKVGYGIGIDLTEDEYAKLLTGKNLRKSLADALYYLQKAEKIIEEIKHYFSFELFRERFYSQQVHHDTEEQAGIQIDVFSALDEYINTLERNNQIRTAEVYISAKNKLRQYIGINRKLFFKDINVKFLNDYEEYLLKNGNTYSTISIYTRSIRKIFNYKKIPAAFYPFGQGKYSPPATENIKKALSMQDLKKLYNYTTVSPQKDKAKDMFFFSYYANGMNFKDIILLKKRSINWSKGEITYYREKTSKRNSKKQIVQILINPDIKRIIKKWGSERVEDEYVFPFLNAEDTTEERILRRVRQTIKTTNKYLKKISEELKLSRHITTNFARHSFSTVLKRSGVPIEMISEQLGHATIKTTQIYLDSFENEQKQAAMQHLEAFKD